MKKMAKDATATMSQPNAGATQDKTAIEEEESSNMFVRPLSTTLNLSSVTMSTKSILDRYRSNGQSSVKDYLRGSYPSASQAWARLSSSTHCRDKSDTLKYDFCLFKSYLIFH